VRSSILAVAWLLVSNYCYSSVLTRPLPCSVRVEFCVSRCDCSGLRDLLRLRLCTEYSYVHACLRQTEVTGYAQWISRQSDIFSFAQPTVLLSSFVNVRPIMRFASAALWPLLELTMGTVISVERLDYSMTNELLQSTDEVVFTLDSAEKFDLI